jgi:hypothetical protein
MLRHEGKDNRMDNDCSEECAKHAPDCDGFCDHDGDDHSNGCMPLELPHMKVALRVKVDVTVKAEQGIAEHTLAGWLRHLAEQVEGGHPLPCETYHPIDFGATGDNEIEGDGSTVIYQERTT